MKRVTRFLILTGVSMLAACATEPASTWTATPTTSAATGTTSTAATGTTSTTSTAATSTAHLIPDGYTREVVNGSELYCRNNLDTGSRVQRTKVCMTWEQLQAQEHSSIQFSTQRTSPDD